VPERILALDFGRRRIGLAVSDELGWTAQGLRSLQRTRLREDLSRLGQLISDYQVSRVVIGLPLQMRGGEGRQAGYVREFGDKVAGHTGLPVEYWDERLTTVEAQRVLRESGVSQGKRGKAVDRMAAILILESWLEHNASREAS
jgi:putative Holliday junction resolvase